MKHPSCIVFAFVASSFIVPQVSPGQVPLATLYPDSASPTSIILRAWINPEGSAGEVRFLWGVSPGYQHVIYAGTYSGSNLIEVRKRIDGLTPDVLYECRAAWIGENSEIGGIIRFRTIADSLHAGYVSYLNFFAGNVGNELAFGIHTQATYCLDENLGEMLIPPPGPQGAPDLRFVDPRGFNAKCMDQGVLLDLRGYRGTTQIDTYQVRLDPGSFGYPVLVSWSNMSTRYNGDVRLCDPSGAVVNVDMKAQNSVLVDDLITQLLIIASSPVRPSIVLSSPEEGLSPNTFTLSQNYPNPFNPATTILYQLPTNEFVVLKLYDLLGREVATLVQEHQKADRYEIRFNANQLASGVYCYRLTAGSSVATKGA